MKYSNCFILVVVAVSIPATVDRAGAQPTNTFLPATGYWHIGENWSLGHEPQTTEEDFIPSGRSCTIIQDNGTGAPSFALGEGWGTDIMRSILHGCPASFGGTTSMGTPIS